MKSVLISIRPQWCEKIASGKKTIEVRKSAPKEVPFKAYIYCSYGDMKTNYYLKGRGKVIGEFICDRVIEWKYLPDYVFPSLRMYYISVDDGEKTCLSYREIEEYGKGKTLYSWHISDLKIYDKPKELSEFKISCNRKNPCCSCCNRFTGKPWDICNSTITRPPQSWQYVEELWKAQN